MGCVWLRTRKEHCDKRQHRKIQAVYQKTHFLIAGSARKGKNFLRERAETLLFQSFKQNWTKPWRIYCREQSYTGPWEWITWPDKSFPSGCYDSFQIEQLFWAWFVLRLDVMWASGQSSDCFVEPNVEEEGEERRAGAIRNREHRKMLTQKCYRALCSQVSQCYRDIKHTLVQVLRWAGGVQALENLIIWCLPQSSQDVWTQRVTVNLLVLGLWRFVFLAVTRIQPVSQSVLLCSCDAHTLSWWCAWLPICTAVDVFRKVARLSCNPGNCQLLPSWKSRTEPLLVSGGVGERYTRKMVQITAVFSASLLTELERNLFPLPSLFSEAEEVAEMSGDNVMSGQN